MRNGNLALPSAVALSAIALSLTACGGGGGYGSPPPPIPVHPTATPKPTATPTTAAKRVVIAWSGAAHSSGASSSSRIRRAAATTTTIEPIEIGANDKYTSQGILLDDQARLSITVTDANGNPVAEPSPSVTIANPSVASYDATGDLVNAGSASATSTLTASFPDGSSGTLPIYVYAHFALSCPADTLIKSNPISEGVTFASGTPEIALDPADADVYLEGPGCDPAYRSGTQAFVEFPYGYAAYPASTPVGTIASATPFTSAGTSILASAVEANPTTYVFKTSTGLYVKWRVDSSGCSGDATNCEVGADAAGLYTISDATGAFPD